LGDMSALVVPTDAGEGLNSGDRRWQLPPFRIHFLNQTPSSTESFFIFLPGQGENSSLT
jgi:hypothetical protein